MQVRGSKGRALSFLRNRQVSEEEDVGGVERLGTSLSVQFMSPKQYLACMCRPGSKPAPLRGVCQDSCVSSQSPC